MDTQFGELRSLLNQVSLDNNQRQAIWQLISAKFDASPEAYEAEWRPYLETFRHHWQRSIQQVKSFESLLQCVEIAPFALFEYEISQEPMSYAWNEVWADHFYHPAMSRVQSLYWRRETALVYLDDLLDSPTVYNLTELHLPSQGFFEDMFLLLVESTLATQLTRLDLSLNDLSDDVLESIFSTTSNLRNLQHLNLAQTHLTAHELEFLTKAPHLSTLESLDLCDNEIWAEGAIVLANSPLQLKSLNVEEGKVGDDGFIALSRMSSLETLDVSWNDIGDEGARVFAQSTELTNLKQLCLSHNDISHDGIQMLLNAPWINTLVDIDLCGLPVNDEVAIAMAKNARLHGIELIFDCEEMTDVGLRALADSPHMSESLRKWCIRMLSLQ